MSEEEALAKLSDSLPSLSGSKTAADNDTTGSVTKPPAEQAGSSFSNLGTPPQLTPAASASSIDPNC